jgi:probable HAF family extracellular repeat protein
MLVTKVSVRNMMAVVALAGSLSQISLAKKPAKFDVIDFPGAVSTITTGVNLTSDIVGIYEGADHVAHGFVLSKNTFQTIDVPWTAARTVAFGINQSGDVVGGSNISNTPGAAGDGFLLSNGVFTKISCPNETGFGTYAYGINKYGQIVGTCLTVTGTGTQVHGFLYENGAFTLFDYPGVGLTNTYAYGINDAGDVVGTYGDSTGKHAFVWQQGLFTQIDGPGATATSAHGISNAGDIVGEYSVAGVEYGYLLSGGVMATLSSTAGTIITGYGIDPNGKLIVGTMTTGSGTSLQIHGYLLAP